ncbi:MAG: glycosyltransferase family 2 protein [Bdellovibrionota bacterium]
MHTGTLDILIPFYNERPALEELLVRLNSCFSPQALTQANLRNVRFIFIDDGSSDGSAEFIAERIRGGLNALLLRLSRNFGHQQALSAGFDHADADFVAVIDADLQDPPELILPMISRLGEGYDIVFGQRRSRSEGWFLRFAYWAFYRLLAVISEVKVPLDAGDFCVLRREALAAIQSLPEKLRFHRGLRSWVGFRQAAFAYDRPPRTKGVTKYTLFALYELATNGVASLSIRPLRITQAVLSFSLLLTVFFIILSGLWYYHLDRHDPVILLLLGTQILLAFFSSLQIFCLYMLGAYVGRMYLEVKSRPAYILMEKFGVSETKN